MTRHEHDPADDRRWLELAVDLARLCSPSESAFSVGAVIVSGGTEIARGWSRETGPHDHAEESALSKLHLARLDLSNATIYSSLEPCSTRRSRPRSCTQLILDVRIPRVVFAWREPSLFADGRGVEAFEAAGVMVIEVPDLAEAAREPNMHLLAKSGGTNPTDPESVDPRTS